MRSEIQKMSYLNQYLLSETIKKPYNNKLYILCVVVLINMYSFCFMNELYLLPYFWEGTRALVLSHEECDTEIIIYQPILLFYTIGKLYNYKIYIL